VLQKAPLQFGKERECNMKKLLFVLAILLIAALVTACYPENPKDVQPYCKAMYEAQLVTYPDYPHAFIGACVAYYQNGNPHAFVSLCGYEPFIASLENPAITTKKECIQYILNFEE
jgi:hypothetical protein